MGARLTRRVLVHRLLAGALVAVALSGCGEERAPGGDSPSERQAARASGTAETGGTAGRDRAPEGRVPPRRGESNGAGRPELPVPPPCPADAVNCAGATGTVIYVERVDPDGDGDAHFVLASPQSITAPGVSVIDVRAELRPDPLPGPGDALAASGPVLPGSYEQRQIQADAVVAPGG